MPNILDLLGGNSSTNEYPFWLEVLKYIWCTIYVFCCVLIVFYGMCVGFTILQVFPLVLFIVLGVSITLLGYCEALHYGVVAIEKWDMTQYKDKFPRAYGCWLLAPTAEAVKRFLVGRQFFTIFQVYLIAQCTLLPHCPDKFLGMSPSFTLPFIQTGMPTTMIILTFGQLIPQLFVEQYTLPFMNGLGCQFVMHLCIWAEFLGVCHYSWLLYHTVAGIVCRSIRQKAIETGQSDTATAEGVTLSDELAEKEELLGPWDLFRFSWSTFVSFCAVFFILTGIARGYAILPASIGVCYVVLILFLGLLFYLEGLMICIVATQFWDRESFKDAYPRAYMLHELVNRPENLKRFIIGRQFFTVLSNILLSQVTAFPAWQHGSFSPVGFYAIVQSGLIGALTTLAFAQLCPELLAAEFPLRFMNMIGSYSVLRISLFIEAVGIGHCGWLCYYVSAKLVCGEHSNVDEIRPGVLRINSQEVLVQAEDKK